MAVSSIPVGVSAQQITLKVHHFWPATELIPTKILAPWCEALVKQSSGRMRCQIYPSMQLGGTPAQLIDQVRDGVVDIAWIAPSYTPGRFTLMEVFELPFMTRSAESSSRAAWDYYQRFANVEFGGVKALVVGVIDPGVIHMRDEQVHTQREFRGLKLRVPTRQAANLVTALGGTPIWMPLPQVADAVSKGVIDGVLMPWASTPVVRLQELVKYHIETSSDSRSLFTVTTVLAMNAARYESLPSDLKRIIDATTGAELSREAGKTWDEAVAAARNAAKERGNVFYTIPPLELNDWERSTQPIADEWINAVDAKGHDGKALLRTARDLMKRYERETVAR